MKTIKYRFDVWYQTKQLNEMSNFLAACDLGIDGMCIKDVLTFTYTKDEQSIDYFKELLNKAFLEIECNIVKIEGGKIE